MGKVTIELNQVVRDALFAQRKKEVEMVDHLRDGHNELWSAVYKQFPELNPEEEHSIDRVKGKLLVNREHLLDDKLSEQHSIVKRERAIFKTHTGLNVSKIWDIIEEQYPLLSLIDVDPSTHIRWEESEKIVLEVATMTYNAEE